MLFAHPARRPQVSLAFWRRKGIWWRYGALKSPVSRVKKARFFEPSRKAQEETA